MYQEEQAKDIDKHKNKSINDITQAFDDIFLGVDDPKSSSKKYER